MARKGTISRRPPYEWGPDVAPVSAEERFNRVALSIQGRVQVIPNGEIGFGRVLDPRHIGPVDPAKAPLVKAMMLQLTTPPISSQDQALGTFELFNEFVKLIEQEIKDLNAGKGALRTFLSEAGIYKFMVEISFYKEGRRKSTVLQYVAPRGVPS